MTSNKENLLRQFNELYNGHVVQAETSDTKAKLKMAEDGSFFVSKFDSVKSEWGAWASYVGLFDPSKYETMFVVYENLSYMQMLACGPTLAKKNKSDQWTNMHQELRNRQATEEELHSKTWCVVNYLL